MMSFQSPRHQYSIKNYIIISIFSLIAACGGDTTTPTNDTDNDSAQSTNNAPTVSEPNANFSINTNETLSYDVSQNNTTFTDADGDLLDYTIELQTFDPDMAEITNELTVNGLSITGTATQASTVFVTVTVDDGNGATVTDEFEVTVTDDDAPNLPQEPFDYVGIVLPDHFTDPDSDFGDVIGQDNQPVNNTITNAGATLGRVLFYDKKLSLNDTVSCSSCHQQSLGFSDSAVLSVGFEGGTTGRHSMGLANARYYERGRFFWDERAATLEDQVLQPIQDSVEMGMELNDLETKLAATSYYPALFEDAFGSETITSNRISDALAQFVRSLVSFQSKYDEAFENGTPDNPDFAGTFTAQERQGLQLFSPTPGLNGRTVQCDACHETAVQTADNVRNNGLDADTSADQGAGNGRFKVPSLRNIAVRAPFMHDGRFATLEEVVEFYNSGVQDHPNLSGRLQNNGEPRRLNLTDNEKAALVAFMETLTDETFLSDEKFSDPF